MECSHKNQIRDFPLPEKLECPKCVALGDTWVHLRQCLICGEVGCCNSSKNNHAQKHFEETNHPIIRSIQPGEDWQFCYVDQIFL